MPGKYRAGDAAPLVAVGLAAAASLGEIAHADPLWRRPGRCGFCGADRCSGPAPHRPARMAFATRGPHGPWSGVAGASASAMPSAATIRAREMASGCLRPAHQCDTAAFVIPIRSASSDRDQPRAASCRRSQAANAPPPLSDTSNVRYPPNAGATQDDYPVRVAHYLAILGISR